MKRLIVMATVVAALAVAGCGGGDDSSSDALSEDDYATQVTGVLAELGPQLQSVGSEIAQQTQVDQIVSGLQQTEDLLQGASDDLDAIEPPESVADAHQQLIDAVDSFGDSTATFREAAEEGKPDESDVSAFQEAGQQFQTELGDVVTQFQDADIQLGPSQ